MLEKKLEYLRELFPDMKIEKNDWHIIVIGNNKSMFDNVFFSLTDDDDKDKTFYINSIQSKIGLNGKTILNKLENFALKFGFKQIYLEDSSHVSWKGIKFYLSYLTIMCKGLSYYNQQGYYQDTFVQDFNHWNKIKNKPILSSIKDMTIFSAKFILSLYFDDDVISVDSLKKGIHYLNPDDTFLSIGTYIYDVIRNNRDVDIDIVCDLFIIISNCINYGNGSLTLPLIKEF